MGNFQSNKVHDAEDATPAEAVAQESSKTKSEGETVKATTLEVLSPDDKDKEARVTTLKIRPRFKGRSPPSERSDDFHSIISDDTETTDYRSAFDAQSQRTELSYQTALSDDDKDSLASARVRSPPAVPPKPLKVTTHSYQSVSHKSTTGDLGPGSMPAAFPVQGRVTDAKVMEERETASFQQELDSQIAAQSRDVTELTQEFKTVSKRSQDQVSQEREAEKDVTSLQTTTIVGYRPVSFKSEADAKDFYREMYLKQDRRVDDLMHAKPYSRSQTDLSGFERERQSRQTVEVVREQTDRKSLHSAHQAATASKDEHRARRLESKVETRPVKHSRQTHSETRISKHEGPTSPAKPVGKASLTIIQKTRPGLPDPKDFIATGKATESDLKDFYREMHLKQERSVRDLETSKSTGDLSGYQQFRRETTRAVHVKADKPRQPIIKPDKPVLAPPRQKRLAVPFKPSTAISERDSRGFYREMELRQDGRIKNLSTSRSTGDLRRYEQFARETSKTVAKKVDSHAAPELRKKVDVVVIETPKSTPSRAFETDSKDFYREMHLKQERSTKDLSVAKSVDDLYGYEKFRRQTTSGFHKSYEDIAVKPKPTVAPRRVELPLAGKVEQDTKNFYREMHLKQERSTIDTESGRQQQPSGSLYGYTKMTQERVRGKFGASFDDSGVRTTTNDRQVVRSRDDSSITRLATRSFEVPEVQKQRLETDTKQFYREIHVKQDRSYKDDLSAIQFKPHSQIAGFEQMRRDETKQTTRSRDDIDLNRITQRTVGRVRSKDDSLLETAGSRFDTSEVDSTSFYREMHLKQDKSTDMKAKSIAKPSSDLRGFEHFRQEKVLAARHPAPREAESARAKVQLIDVPAALSTSLVSNTKEFYREMDLDQETDYSKYSSDQTAWSSLSKQEKPKESKSLAKQFYRETHLSQKYNHEGHMRKSDGIQISTRAQSADRAPKGPSTSLPIGTKRIYEYHRTTNRGAGSDDAVRTAEMDVSTLRKRVSSETAGKEIELRSSDNRFAGMRPKSEAVVKTGSSSIMDKSEFYREMRLEQDREARSGAVQEPRKSGFVRFRNELTKMTSKLGGSQTKLDNQRLTEGGSPSKISRMKDGVSNLFNQSFGSSIKRTASMPSVTKTKYPLLVSSEGISKRGDGVFVSRVICDERAPIPLEKQATPQGKAPVIIDRLRNVDIDIGQSVTLTAEVTGFPQPLITWKHDNRIIKDSWSTKISYYGRTASLTLTNVQFNQSGTYSLTAENTEGDASTSCTVRVHPAVPVAVDVPDQRRKPKIAKELHNLAVGEGKSARLDCIIECTPNPEVKWYKDDREIRESSRLITSDEGERYSLEIRSAQSTDSGLYKCVARNQYGEVTSVAKLFVLETGPMPPSHAPPAIQRGLEHLEAREGDRITMEGRIAAGRDSKHVWQLNGSVLKPGPNIEIVATPSGIYRLTILKATMRDSGTYSLTVSNKDGETKTSCTLKVTSAPLYSQTDKYSYQHEVIKSASAQSPPEIIKHLTDSYVKLGDSIRMEATVAGHPKPKISWFLNGQRIRLPHPHFTTIKDRCIVSIQCVKDEHIGEYWLVAENEAGKAETFGKIILDKDIRRTHIEEDDAKYGYTIDTTYELIHEPPVPPKFVQTLTSAIVVEGNDAVFEGFVTGTSLPDIRWKRDDEEIKPGPRIKMTYQNGKVFLCIKNTTVSDTGKIICVASNECGVASSSAQLVIRPLVGAPDFRSRLVTKDVDEGSDIEWIVEVVGDPPPSVAWYRNGEPLHPGPNVILSQKVPGTYSLILRNVNSHHAGQYTAKAENIGGEAQTTAELFVRSKADATLDGGLEITNVFKETQDAGIEGHIHQEHLDYLYKERDSTERVIGRIGDWFQAIPPKPHLTTPGFSNPGSHHSHHHTSHQSHYEPAPHNPGPHNRAYHSPGTHHHGQFSAAPHKPGNPTVNDPVPPTIINKNDSHHNLGSTNTCVYNPVAITAKGCATSAPESDTCYMQLFSAAVPDGKATGHSAAAGCDGHYLGRSINRCEDRHVGCVVTIDNRRVGCEVKTDDRILGCEVKTDDRRVGCEVKVDDRRVGCEVKTDDRRVGCEVKTDDRRVACEIKTDDRQVGCGITTDSRRVCSEVKINDRHVGCGMNIEETSCSVEKSISPRHDADREKAMNSVYPIDCSAAQQHSGVETSSATKTTQEGSDERSAPTFSKELKTYPLKIGGDITLECHVSGFPTPEIRWLKNGTDIPDVFRYKVNNNTKTGVCKLDLGMMLSEDIGEYKCIASNKLGQAESCAHIMFRDDYEAWLETHQSKSAKENKMSLLQELEAKGEIPRRPKGTFIQPASQRLLEQHISSKQKYESYISSHPNESDTHWITSESETDAEDRLTPAAPSMLQELQPIQLTEGSNALLRCRITGHPTPKIQWTKNDVQVIPSQRCSLSYKNGLASLQIKMVFPEDTGQYKVVAENEHGQCRSVTDMYVAPLSGEQGGDCGADDAVKGSEGYMEPSKIMPLKVESPVDRLKELHAPVIIRAPRSVSVKEGHIARLDVKLAGNPPPAVDWLKDNIPIVDGERHKLMINQEGLHSLLIHRTIPDDEGSYRCHAYNPEGEVNIDMGLNVEACPSLESPYFTQKMASVTAEPGEPVSLMVKFSPSDATTVIWMKEQTQLTNGQPYRIYTKDGESGLFIDDARLDDSGWFQCSVHNAAGTTSTRARINVHTKSSRPDSAPSELRNSPEQLPPLRHVERSPSRNRKQDLDEDSFVPQPPRFLASPVDLNLQEGQPAHLECRLEPAKDPSMQIAWLKDGNRLNASSRVTTIHDFGYATLDISSVYPEDSGIYTCVAANCLGEANASARIKVSGEASIITDSLLSPKASQAFASLELRRQIQSTPRSSVPHRRSAKSPCDSPWSDHELEAINGGDTDAYYRHDH